MADSFIKRNRGGDNLPGEAAGLRWLADASTTGGVRVVQVIAVDAARLEITRVDESRPTVSDAQHFGRALAHTHAAGADWWGTPPAQWLGPAWVGRSHTPLVMDGALAPHAWGEFYAEYRIGNFARRLRDSGVITMHQQSVFDAVSHRLGAGEFDVPQPRLVTEAGHRVARLHGDLWSGNVMYDSGPTGATVIDPMAHGGHAETDLAALSVFGFPHLAEVYRAYDAESPLAEGWQERIGLHQLTMIIMHAVLFGGGYIGQALELASEYA